MVKSAHRINRSYRIAQWSEVQSIYYAVTLTAFFHRWALILLSVLIPSAVTALQFLAALNRASKNGWAGCAVAYELLAPHIAHATGRKCSVRTLERGIAFLKKLGMVSLSFWTLPDQEIQNGPYMHRIRGTGKIKRKNGEWTSKQIRIIVLTDRAIGLWDRRTQKNGSDIMRHFAQFLTAAKLTANPQIDLVDKPTKIVVPTSTSGATTCVRKDDQEIGQTTSPEASPQAVEHLSLSPTNENTSADSDRAQIAVNSPNDTVRSDVHHAELGHGIPLREQNSDQIDKKISKLRGCTHTPPPIPKNAKNKTTWAIARQYLLHEIHWALSNFSSSEADSIYERARWELSTESRNGIPTIVDWAYWVGRFAKFSQKQRRGHVIREILPLLRSSTIPIPSEYRASSPAVSETISRNENKQLSPFLARIFKKFVD